MIIRWLDVKYGKLRQLGLSELWCQEIFLNITQIMQEFCMPDIIYFYTYRVCAAAMPENSMRYLQYFQALKSADMPYNPD